MLVFSHVFAILVCFSKLLTIFVKCVHWNRSKFIYRVAKIIPLQINTDPDESTLHILRCMGASENCRIRICNNSNLPVKYTCYTCHVPYAFPSYPAFEFQSTIFPVAQSRLLLFSFVFAGVSMRYAMHIKTAYHVHFDSHFIIIKLKELGEWIFQGDNVILRRQEIHNYTMNIVGTN